MSNHVILGDTVEYTGNAESPNYVKSLVGREGRVAFIREGEVLVQWRDWDSGHDGYLQEDFQIKAGVAPGSTSCWYVQPKEVTVVGEIVENE